LSSKVKLKLPNDSTDTLQATLDYLQSVAKKLGLSLNPDDKALNRTASYMASNVDKYGKRFCPCKQHHPVDESSDPICPCREFRDEIKRDGHCECHIFWDPDAAIKAKTKPGLLATIACPG
jgi:ferredoxin-thioredoxin reductase catalytic subunit